MVIYFLRVKNVIFITLVMNVNTIKKYILYCVLFFFPYFLKQRHLLEQAAKVHPASEYISGPSKAGQNHLLEQVIISPKDADV